MKVSIAVSVFILVVGALLGFQNKARLEVVRVTHQKVTEEAGALGIRLNSEEDEEAGDGLTKLSERDQLRKDAETRAVVKRVVDFAKKMEEVQAAGEQPGEEFQEEMMEMMQVFLDLDARQLKMLVGELRESKEVSDESRQGIIGFSIMMMASEHPESALALMAESADMIDLGGMKEHVVSSSLASWAANDPAGALAWIEANSDANADLLEDGVKASVVGGAARKDPALALQLLGELNENERDAAYAGIADGAVSSEQRTALLEAIRAHGGNEGEKRALIREMGENASADGFGPSMRWLEEVAMSKEETEMFADGLSNWELGEDTGKWMDWIEGKVPDDDLDQRVQSMMGGWTQSDPNAAGLWLNDAEDGPMKEAAVSSYADRLAPYEPGVAAQWVETLPEGDKKQQLVSKIHKEWQAKDEEAAAAYARQQGLDEQDADPR